MHSCGLVLLQVFKNVADVQEGVAVEADIHEGRLHAGKHAGYAAFVYASHKRELLLALNVNLYKLTFFENGHTAFVGRCGNN